MSKSKFDSNSRIIFVKLTCLSYLPNTKNSNSISITFWPYLIRVISFYLKCSKTSMNPFIFALTSDDMSPKVISNAVIFTLGIFFNAGT
jgi:hypothetical protein